MTLTLDPPVPDPTRIDGPRDDGTRRELLIGGAALALGLAACGDDDAGERPAAGSDGFPRTIRHASGTTTIRCKPERVFAMQAGPDAETLLALGIVPAVLHRPDPAARSRQAQLTAGQGADRR